MKFKQFLIIITIFLFLINLISLDSTDLTENSENDLENKDNFSEEENFEHSFKNQSEKDNEKIIEEDESDLKITKKEIIENEENLEKEEIIKELDEKEKEYNYTNLEEIVENQNSSLNENSSLNQNSSLNENGSLNKKENITEITELEKETKIGNNSTQNNFTQNNQGNSRSYANIKELEEISGDSDINEISGKKEEKVIKEILYKDGKKQIEFEHSEEEIEIKKIENEKGELTKEIIVSSKTHFNNSLKVYSDLPKETEKENINIYWENENIEITKISEFKIEYYDTNRNELIDRISWIIPHLSEQIFTINISLTTLEEGEEISIDGEISEIKNPLVFYFNISYKNISNLSCSLNINDTLVWNGTPEDETIIKTGNLSDGIYNWNFSCFDKEDSSISNSTSEIFSIDASFEVSKTEKEVYLTKEKDVLFNVSSNLEGKISIDLNLPNGTIIKNIFNETLNSSKSYSISKNYLNKEGIYKINVTSYALNNTRFEIREFSVAKIEFETDKSFVKIGENFNINVNVSSPKGIGYIILTDEKGTLLDEPPSNNYFSKSITINYSSIGDYTITLIVQLKEREYDTITKEVEVIQNNVSDIIIKLISPKDDSILTKQNVDFLFEIKSNLPIKNCTSEVWRTTSSFGGKSTSIDKKIDLDIELNTEYKIPLKNLKEDYYIWEVTCYDNSSTEEIEWHYFTINTTKKSENNLIHEKTEKIEEIIGNINNFFEKEKSSFELEEKEAIKSLNLLDELNSYKGRLVQINKDLANAILSDERRNELYNEIENITKKIPIDLKVIETGEYVKNNFEGKIEEILSKYFEYKGIKIERNLLKKIILYNENLQKNFFTETKVQKVEIEYNNSQEKITLISKKLNIEEDEKRTIIEYFPEKITENIIFITKSKQIEKNLFEIDKNEEEIIYYLEEFVDLTDIKKIETILFEETIPITNSGITGSAVVIFKEINSNLYWILFIGFSVFIVSGFFVYRKIKIREWEREPNFLRIKELIRQSNLALKEGDLENSKNKYKKIQEIYPLLEENCRNFLYNKIRNIRILIDKKDILNLLREYQKAKNEFRKEDAFLLYEKIKSVYKRLPKRYREKIYEKLNSRI